MPNNPSTLLRTKGLQTAPFFNPSLHAQALKAFASTIWQFSSLCFYQVFQKYLRQKTTEVPHYGHCYSPVLPYLRAFFLVQEEGRWAKHRFPPLLPPALPPSLSKEKISSEITHSFARGVDMVFDLFSKDPREKRPHPCWEMKPGALCRAAWGPWSCTRPRWPRRCRRCCQHTLNVHLRQHAAPESGHSQPQDFPLAHGGGPDSFRGWQYRVRMTFLALKDWRIKFQTPILHWQ